MRYINTDELIEREGQLFHHCDRTWMSEEPAGTIVADMTDHPEIFKHIENKADVYDLRYMWRGSLRFPAYSYDPTTDTFTRVDSWRQEWARHAIRRRLINDDLKHGGVLVETELKALRLAVTAIAQTLPELAELPEVAALLDVSSFVESRIAVYEKDTEIAEAEAYRRNGEHSNWWMADNPLDIKEVTK